MSDEPSASKRDRRLPGLSARTALYGFLGLSLGSVLAGRRRTGRQRAQLVEELQETASERPVGTVTPEDYADLPDPVRRYFETVLEPGQSHIRTARLKQRGEFRLGDSESAWHPLQATQHYAVSPPGFVWDATIRLGSVLPTQVVDSYVDGIPTLSARLLWTVPVADAAPTPELAAGELSRYLAEAVWFPTALLPTNGVEWEPVDDDAARATLTHGGTTVSLVFHFDEANLVDRVVAENRFRAVGDGFERSKWTGRFADYERRDGMLVPTSAEVEWNLPSGDLPYWRGRITRFEFDLGE
ncbi:DUF6920 family protein [Haloarcula nitratireducens]|uniref:Uncharacterized protein n=1 Tax=Haloarcula nitratireducens TaxID=2487749 RepID=A0AAW4P9Q3_9EURY|nr:DUF6544 family protein [Halomicroarcula nitratireducens]MBX0294630.1 hypothetical protein [Halomicroarcula nitratireducens]